MIGLIRAEVLKLAKRRLLWVMMLIFAALLGLVAVIFLVLPTVSPGALEGLPTIEKPLAYTFGASQALGQTWFPMVLAVVLLGGETGTSIWPSSLTRESRRWMHLIAKTLVTTVAAWLANLLAIAGWALLAAIFAEGSGSPSITEWLSIAGKAGLTEFTWVALAFGATGLLRSIGPALGVALGFSFGEGILALWRPWQQISLTAASDRLIGDFGELAAGVGIGFASSMSFGQALAVVLGWALLGVGLAILGLQVRDP
jgi:hypothetical protein